MPNAYNEKPTAFTGGTDRWARVEPITGKEFWFREQSSSMVTHTVNMRYFPGLTSRHGLVLAGRSFGIDSVVDLKNLHEEHELRCIEAT